jgi:hypothetical protein
MTLVHPGLRALARSPLPPFVKGGARRVEGFATADHVYESSMVRFSHLAIHHEEGPHGRHLPSSLSDSSHGMIN